MGWVYGPSLRMERRVVWGVEERDQGWAISGEVSTMRTRRSGWRAYRVRRLGGGGGGGGGGCFSSSSLGSCEVEGGIFRWGGGGCKGGRGRGGRWTDWSQEKRRLMNQDRR